MTTTTHDEPRPPATGRAGATPGRDDKAVGLWLLICSAMIFAMAVIGAVTRLTESGLSIMEWAPLSGALPWAYFPWGQPMILLPAARFLKIPWRH